MKKSKLMLIALMTCSILTISACGSNSNKSSDNSNVATASNSEDASAEIIEIPEAPLEEFATLTSAEEKTNSVFKVTVPKGYGYESYDEYENGCIIKASENEYIEFIIEDDKESLNKAIEISKQYHDFGQTDVSKKIGDYTWTGFQYETNYSGSGFDVYLESDDAFIRVSAVGFGFDSKDAITIMESFKLN